MTKPQKKTILYESSFFALNLSFRLTIGYFPARWFGSTSEWVGQDQTDGGVGCGNLLEQAHQGVSVVAELAFNGLRIIQDDHFPGKIGRQTIPQGIQVIAVIFGEVQFLFQIGMRCFSAGHFPAFQTDDFHLQSIPLPVKLFERFIMIIRVKNQSVIRVYDALRPAVAAVIIDVGLVIGPA